MVANVHFSIRAKDDTRAAFSSVKRSLSTLETHAAVAGRRLFKAFDLKGVVGAAAIAVGLSVDKVAEKLARLYTGTSEEQEKLGQEFLELQDQLAGVQGRNARERLGEELYLKKLLQDRDRLLGKLSRPGGDTDDQRNERLRDQLKLEETIAEISSTQRDVEAARAKLSDEYNESIERLAGTKNGAYVAEVSASERLLGLHAKEAGILHKLAGTDITNTKERIRLNNELANVSTKIGVLMEDQTRLGREMGATVGASFEDAIFSGEKLSDVVRQLGVYLMRILFRNAITEPLAKGMGGIFNSVLGAVGFRASGGPVSSGSPYIVGERGPELFVPSTAGRVMANHDLGKSGAGSHQGDAISFTYNIGAGVTAQQLIPILALHKRDIVATIADAKRRRTGLGAALA